MLTLEILSGLTATIMKQGSNQAIRFFVMESMKDWYRNKYYGGDRQKPINKVWSHLNIIILSFAYLCFSEVLNVTLQCTGGVVKASE